MPNQIQLCQLSQLLYMSAESTGRSAAPVDHVIRSFKPLPRYAWPAFELHQTRQEHLAEENEGVVSGKLNAVRTAGTAGIWLSQSQLSF
jgi:hypothetical protein